MKTSSLEIPENAELPHAILKVMASEIASAQESLVTKTDLLATKADLNAGLVALREQILSVKGEMLEKMGGIEGKLTRWVFTCILGRTAVLVGFGYFLLGHGGK